MVMNLIFSFSQHGPEAMIRVHSETGKQGKKCWSGKSQGKRKNNKRSGKSQGKIFFIAYF